MRDTDSEKKTYERPTLEKKQTLVEIAEGTPSGISGVPE